MGEEPVFWLLSGRQEWVDPVAISDQSEETNVLDDAAEPAVVIRVDR